MRPWTLIRITLYGAFSFLIVDYVNPSLKMQVAGEAAGAKFVVPGQEEPASLIDALLEYAQDNDMGGVVALHEMHEQGGITGMYARVAEAVKSNMGGPDTKRTPVNLQPSPGAKFVGVDN